MKDLDVRRYWNDNAAAWTQLARSGYDIYRDHLNTPAFLQLLPDVAGLSGLDIGCGEGHNTRLLARCGACMCAVDIAEAFIGYAANADSLCSVDYAVATASRLPFANGAFDFAVAIMSLMDIPDTELVLAEAYRILQPGGFLQFSITHPCFNTPHRRNLRNAEGVTYAIEVGDYYRKLEGEIEQWLFGAAPAALRQTLPKFQVPRFTRTLSEWFYLLIKVGFMIECVAEPRPSDDAVRAQPTLQDAQVVAYFLHLRVRKPKTAER